MSITNPTFVIVTASNTLLTQLRLRFHACLNALLQRACIALFCVVSDRTSLCFVVRLTRWVDLSMKGTFCASMSLIPYLFNKRVEVRIGTQRATTYKLFATCWTLSIACHHRLMYAFGAETMKAFL